MKSKIKDFLIRQKDSLLIEDEKYYKRVKIKINHQGISLRDKVKGSLIGTKSQFRIKEGQFILSKIDARYGAFGIVPMEVDNGIITGNFWTYDIDSSKVDIDWFNQFTSSREFYEICEKASSGTTHRKYLDEKAFMNFEIALPSLEEQKQIMIWFRNISTRFQDLTNEFHTQVQYLSHFRQSILQELVQGKLVQQSPNDEPATELLKKINTEKEKLIAEGKLKRDKPLPPITDEEIPFELPKGWVWCRVGEIVNLNSGVTLGKAYSGSLTTVPYLRVANVQRGYLDLKKVKDISVPSSDVEKYKLNHGDLLMVEGGDWDKVGRCAIWRNEIKICIHQNHIFRLRFYGGISNEWAELYLNSPIARRYFESCSKQTTNLASINQTQLRNLLFPLPPISTQIKCTEKVRSVEHLCRALKASIDESSREAEQLLENILRTAFNEPDQMESKISIPELS